MSNFYNQASWVLVPSGIEEDIVFAQKPISGLGDLTYTRASDATYTDSTGVVRRSPYNLLQMSEMFADSYWLKTGSTITANATPAPNNTLTADKLVEDSLSSEHGFARVGGITTSGVYTFSAFVKAAERTRVALGNSSTGQYVIFDLSAGTVVQGSQGTVTNAAISSIDANGFYRISCNITVSSASSVRVNLVSTGTTINYTGDGISGIFIWGAQLVEGTSALDYFPTTNRQDVPRIDFRNADGTLSSCGRLLLEPQRTNSIRNSSMVGAVAGSPGTLPTNWVFSNLTGLTSTVVGTGTENGLPYVDLRFNGTSTTTNFEIRFETSTQIAATNGQIWTFSPYVKVINGTFNSAIIGIIERTSVGGFVAFGSSPLAITSTLQRFSFTRTLAGGATVAFAQPLINFNLTNGAAYDFTIRIAAPQMELGAYATTWVPTTTAAVTRLADTASKTGVSSLIGQTEGTLFAEVDIKNVVATTRGILEIRTTGTQTIALICFSNGNLGGYIINGTDQFVRSITTVAGRYKMALAYSAASTVLYINGQIVGSASTSVSVPTSSAVQVGIYGIANHLGDSITQVALFPTRLTNAQLAQLTTL